MAILADIGDAVANHARFVEQQVRRARTEPDFASQIMQRWEAIRRNIPSVTTPTGLKLPRLALPNVDEPGEIARFLFGEGMPGEFPFVSAAYPRMYLTADDGQADSTEEPTRLFAGMGLAEDTNKRFHFLKEQQKSIRLSTAFDGPTLYGMDSDADGVFGKIGEGGVAIDTIDDIDRLYAGFMPGQEHASVSMTINGPAPTILAMYVAAAIRRVGPEVLPRLRGTIQADVLKEVQAQNETLFPIEASLRFLGDMVEYTTRHLPRWYPISISGYHIAEAGATPVQQAAYTLSNGFTYVDLFRRRGMNVNEFGPRLSFFLDCGLDVEYVALPRVCRKIWAIGMRDIFAGDERAQRFKLHIQTSGRSLVASEFKNNLTRTAVELMLAYMNNTNSCHSNSADEPFTTPAEEYVRLAAHSQAILLEESGLFKQTMNLLSGSPGMKAVEEAVGDAILEEFREIDRLGGVLSAVEHRYQRSQIQSAAYRYERQIHDGTRPIIGINRYRSSQPLAEVRLVRTSREKQQRQVDRVQRFKRVHARHADRALDELSGVVVSGGNVFAQLVQTVEHCTLGQITTRLQEIVGKFRPMV